MRADRLSTGDPDRARRAGGRLRHRTVALLYSRSTATSDGAPAARYAVIVGPVFVPAAVDRPEFVVQIAPNQVEHRRVQPLGGAARRRDRARRRRRPRGPARHLRTSRWRRWRTSVPPIACRSTCSASSRCRVESVLIDAVWTVHPAAGGESRSGRTIARETVQGKSFDALAAAHSRALAAVSAEIAAAIRAAAA